MNIFQKYLADRRAFDVANEGAGGGGGDDAAAAEAAAAAAAAADDGAGGGGGDDKPFAWFGDDVDADTKQYLEAKSFKQPKDLYKSLRAAEKMIRGDQISGPPEDAEKHGDWLKESGLAKRLGIPDAPDGYGIEKLSFDESVAPMVNYDDERHGRVMEKMHQLNLTPAQAQGMLGLYSEEIAGDAQAFSTEAAADEERMQTALKKEWGEGYKENLTAALEVAKESGLDEAAIESLRVAKVAGSTTLTKILHELAVVRGNDTLKGGSGPGTQTTQADAGKQLTAFQEKNRAALTDRNHAEHASAMAEFEALKKKAGRGSVGRA